MGRGREGFGWEGIEFAEVARGEERQVGMVVEALIEVARDHGIDCEVVDGGEWEIESLGRSGRSGGTSSGRGSTARREMTYRSDYSAIGNEDGLERRPTESLSSSTASSSNLSLRSLTLNSNQSTPTRRQAAGKRHGTAYDELRYRADSTLAGSNSPPDRVATHVHVYSDDESSNDDSQRTRSERPNSKSKRTHKTPPPTNLEDEEVGKCPCVECGGTVIMSTISADIADDEEQCIHQYSSPDSAPSTPRIRRKRTAPRSTTSTHSSSKSTTPRSSKSELPSSSRLDPPLSPSLSKIPPPRPYPSASRSGNHDSLNPILDSSSDAEYHASAAQIPYITRPHFISDDDASSAAGREAQSGGEGGERRRGSSSESSGGDTVILVERKERLMKQLAELRAGR